VLLYQASDGATRLEVRTEDETVWLLQNQMAELFQTFIPNVRMHIRNVFEERKLRAPPTVKESLTVRQEGSRKVSRSVERARDPAGLTCRALKSESAVASFATT
jgi:hypothetical protein